MQTRQTAEQENNIANNNNNKITKIQQILSEILLLLFEDRQLSDNILRVQESIIVKSKDCSRNLLNKI